MAVSGAASLGDVDLRLLRVFRSVVECGGFSAAEADLDVARSTISTHIANLESRLGLTLCQRGRAGFALTESGRLVYDETLRLLAAVDGFHARVEAAHDRLVGDLDLATIDNVLTLPELDLPGAIRRFRARAPRVQVNLRVMAADEIERGLLDGRLHAGVLAPHRQRSALVYRPVAHERQHLYCGSAHPLFGRPDRDLDAAALETLEVVGRSHLDEARARDRPFRAVAAASANSLEAILILILSGCYAGLLPTQYAEPWARRGAIRALRPDLIEVEKSFSLVTRRTRPPLPAVAVFLECVGGDGPSGTEVKQSGGRRRSG